MTHIPSNLYDYRPARTKCASLKFAFLTAVAAVSLALVSTSAHAQRVQPMSYELGPSGSKASTSLRIENTSKVDMTLELLANKISVDENGNESLTPAEDDFLIFPPQLILKAGKTQAIRVKYIGEPTIKQSEPYRISVKQIPIDLSGGGKSAVGMVVNFHTLAHVTPQSAKVDLQVTKIATAPSGGWALSISNSGKKMGRLSQTVWKLKDGGQSKTLSVKDVADMTDKNLVMPGQTLNLIIPAIAGFNPSTTTVEINAKS